MPPRQATTTTRTNGSPEAEASATDTVDKVSLPEPEVVSPDEIPTSSRGRGPNAFSVRFEAFISKANEAEQILRLPAPEDEKERNQWRTWMRQAGQRLNLDIETQFEKPEKLKEADREKNPHGVILFGPKAVWDKLRKAKKESEAA